MPSTEEPAAQLPFDQRVMGIIQEAARKLKGIPEFEGMVISISYGDYHLPHLPPTVVVAKSQSEGGEQELAALSNLLNRTSQSLATLTDQLCNAVATRAQKADELAKEVVEKLRNTLAMEQQVLQDQQNLLPENPISEAKKEPPTDTTILQRKPRKRRPDFPDSRGLDS